MRVTETEQAENLADKILCLTDRRVGLSDSDSAQLKSALRALDESQREIDLAKEAKSKLIDHQIELKQIADELRAKQVFEDEDSLLKSSLADRRLTLFSSKVQEATAFISQAERQYAERWWAVKTVVRFALQSEYAKRGAIVTEILSSLFEGIDPTFVRTQFLPKVTCLASLGNLLVDLNATISAHDTLHGNVHLQLVDWSRSLNAGTFSI